MPKLYDLFSNSGESANTLKINANLLFIVIHYNQSNDFQSIDRNQWSISINNS